MTKLVLTEGSAPAVGAAGTDVIYADSSAHTLKVSLNGAAYTTLGGATAPLTLTGTTDSVQLDVRANATQTAQLQTWKDTTGNVNLAVNGAGALNDGSNNWQVRFNSGGITGIRFLDASSTAYLHLHSEKYVDAPWFTCNNGRQRVDSDVTNATTTMATVTGLSATLSTNTGTKYSGEIVLYVNDSTAADGVKLDFDGGTCTVSSFRAQGYIADTVSVRPLVQTSALATDMTDATTTGDAIIRVKFSFVLSGDGMFIVRAAQNAHTTGTLTVYANSHMDIDRRP